MKTPKERDIEQYLIKRVKALGGEVRKVKWTGRNNAPDRVVWFPEKVIKRVYITAVVPPRQVWVELKRPGEKARPGQVREHNRMRALGQRVEVVDSFERVDEVLK